MPSFLRIHTLFPTQALYEVRVNVVEQGEEGDERRI